MFEGSGARSQAEIIAGFDEAFEGPECTPEEPTALDGFWNRVLSFTLMHERFGMGG